MTDFKLFMMYLSEKYYYSRPINSDYITKK
jgi:hypothetical protein